MSLGAPDRSIAQSAAKLRRVGIAALGAGLFGHVLAALAIGGTSIAYRDHLLGFLVLTVVSVVLLYACGRRFWRTRPEYTVLILGVLQAGFGLWAYLERFSFHG